MISLDKNHYYVKTTNLKFIWAIGSTKNTFPYALVLNPKNSKKYEYYDISAFKPNLRNSFANLRGTTNNTSVIVIYEKINLTGKHVKIPRIIIFETSLDKYKYFVNKR